MDIQNNPVMLEKIKSLSELYFQLIMLVIKTANMGIRLNINETYPFIAWIGFSDDFIVYENSNHGTNDLSPLGCVCGQIINGPMPMIEHLFTEKGSFYCTSPDHEIFEFAEDIDGFDGRCFRENNGQAFIPIKGKLLNGLMFLSDNRISLFQRDRISDLERISNKFSELLDGIFNSSIKKNLNIVIIDENALISFALKVMLEEFGHTCTQFSSPNQSYEYIVNNKIDAIIMELSYTGSESISFIEKIYSQLKKYGPKIIIITTDPTVNIDDFEESNVIKIFQKPYGDHEIAAALIDAAM